MKRWGNRCLAGKMSITQSRLQVSASRGASPGGQGCQAALLSFFCSVSHAVLGKSMIRMSPCHLSPCLWEGRRGTQMTRIPGWVTSFLRDEKQENDNYDFLLGEGPA